MIFLKTTTLKAIISRYICLIISLSLLSIYAMAKIGGRAMLSYLVFAGAIVLIDLTISKLKLSRWIVMPLLTVLSLSSFFEVLHSILFNDRFSSSSFYILLETNVGESLEFIDSISSVKVILVVLVSITSYIVSVYTFWTSKVFDNKSFKVFGCDVRYFFLLITILVTFLLKNSFFPFWIVSDFQNYLKEKTLLSQLACDKKGGDFHNVIHSDTDKEVYVLIVGESTTSFHMSLYDYPRETNPLLQQIEDELTIYSDVVTPHVHTIAALGKVLTMSSFESIDSLQGNILQLFNKAGFETYWISNQKPLGMFETSVSRLSNSANHRVFTNVNENTLDEVLFIPFEKALKDDYNKKLIVLHLMGSHLNYAKRYTESYNQFVDKPDTKFNQKKAWTSINTYDNAILYNDFIVHSFITKLNSYVNLKSCLLYLSDHGEEVFHDKGFAIHAEYDETKDMYDIPFVLWKSPKFVSTDSRLFYDVHRKFSTEFLIYSLADLASISFDEFVPSRSVFNTSFIETQRFITNKRPYDEIFKK